MHQPWHKAADEAQLTLNEIAFGAVGSLPGADLDALIRRSNQLLELAPSELIRFRFTKVPLIAALLRDRGVVDTSRRADLARRAEEYCRLRWQRGVDTEDLLEVARNWADFARDAEAWPEALKAYTFADQAVHRIARAMRGQPRIDFLADKSGRILVDFAYTCYQLGRPMDAILALERGQSLLIAPDEASRTLSRLELSGHADEVNRYRTAVAKVRAVRQRKAKATTDQERDVLGRQETLGQQEAQTALDILRLLPGCRLLNKEVDWPEVLSAAQASLLLYIFEATPAVVSIVVGRDGLHAHWATPLAPQTMSRLVRDWRIARHEGHAEDEPRLLDAVLKETFVVIKPVFSLIGRPTTLRIIAAGSLRSIPFHAAGPDEAGTRLHDKAIVTYAASARIIGTALKTASTITRRRFVGVADPRPLPQDYVELPGARAEVRSAASRYRDRRLLLGTDATAAAMLAAIPDANVLHVATHGEVMKPGFTAAIVLANGQGFGESTIPLGPPLSLRLAVLSCCWVGHDNPTLRDQTVSLPAVLLQAGACAVIAGSRPVEDDATAFLVARFFELWMRDPDNPASALWVAQSWLRQVDRKQLRRARRRLFGFCARSPRIPPNTQIAHPYQHPSTWASMSYYGV